MQGHVLASAHPHPQLEPIQAVQPTHSLPVHQPALTSQQHPDTLIAESRSGVGQIANAEPEARLIFRPTPSIPGRPAELS